MSHLKTHVENLAREIRSPLNFMLGATERLLDSQLSPDERSLWERLKACGESFRQATEDILPGPPTDGDNHFRVVVTGTSGAARAAAAHSSTRGAAQRASKDAGDAPSKAELAAKHHRAARATATPPFDRKAALKRIDGDEQLLAEVIDVFKHDALLRMERIRTALAEGNAKVLEHTAHSLKGAAGALSGEPMAEAASRLEEIGRKGDFRAAAGAVADLERELARFTAAISEAALPARV
jgi:HPt (histidine-containing phosphotransfer) domain-containing protein